VVYSDSSPSLVAVATYTQLWLPALRYLSLMTVPDHTIVAHCSPYMHPTTDMSFVLPHVLLKQGAGVLSGLPPGVIRYNNSREALSNATKGLGGGGGVAGLPPGVIKYPAGGGVGQIGGGAALSRAHSQQQQQQPAQLGPIKMPGAASLNMGKSRY